MCTWTTLRTMNHPTNWIGAVKLMLTGKMMREQSTTLPKMWVMKPMRGSVLLLHMSLKNLIALKPIKSSLSHLHLLIHQTWTSGKRWRSLEVQDFICQLWNAHSKKKAKNQSKVQDKDPVAPSPCELNQTLISFLHGNHPFWGEKRKKLKSWIKR